ncbi:glycerophosphodiester phosphodiesterase [Lachnospiraceae bacterium PAL113]|uniref:Glycerophosphodiester phosphodiesterase n=2 Tax=Aequitasia blattaphilus TaxID=2949332 RepID=A0ABT1EBS3_9FIRM|nr:glycerophosphodiester phosphodiesterase [Aequitasia blattaphilus]MCR8615903.1 glycerophosphodiester phosphodiesterase [Aequitasia blattaphilus]
MKQYIGEKFAHRGYHNIHKGIPENSMAAFSNAISNHYGIELDVQMTRDKEVVVFHDDSLKRICNADGFVKDYSYEELRQFSLARTGMKIPLLRDVLTLVDGKVPLLIEIKMPNNNYRLCRETYRLLKTYTGPYLIQSFNPLVLYWFKKNASEVLRGQLSSHRFERKDSEKFVHRFSLTHLLSNFIGRPDFISYQFPGTETLTNVLLFRVLHLPYGVWTLRTDKDISYGKTHYSMIIFEDPDILKNS